MSIRSHVRVVTTASDTATGRAYLWSAIRADRPHQQAPVSAETQEPVPQHQQLQDARAVAAQPPDAAAGPANSILRGCIGSAVSDEAPEPQQQCPEADTGDPLGLNRHVCLGASSRVAVPGQRRLVAVLGGRQEGSCAPVHSLAHHNVGAHSGKREVLLHCQRHDAVRELRPALCH